MSRRSLWNTQRCRCGSPAECHDPDSHRPPPDPEEHWCPWCGCDTADDGPCSPECKAHLEADAEGDRRHDEDATP